MKLELGVSSGSGGIFTFTNDGAEVTSDDMYSWFQMVCPNEEGTERLPMILRADAWEPSPDQPKKTWTSKTRTKVSAR
jgi:hypothetical protein